MGTSTKYAPWSPAMVTAVADVLAATDDGLRPTAICSAVARVPLMGANGLQARVTGSAS
ncbi:hypothetical protein ACWCPJ_39420 [Streptomyces collinus]